MIDGEATVYLRTLARAEAKSTAEAWDEAGTLWERIVAANPVEGRYWSRLGDARFHGKDERAAVVAYQRALDLRDGFPAETAHRIGCCHARLGESGPAIEWLERAFAMGYRHLSNA